MRSNLINKAVGVLFNMSLVPIDLNKPKLNTILMNKGLYLTSKELNSVYVTLIFTY